MRNRNVSALIHTFSFRQAVSYQAFTSSVVDVSVITYQIVKAVQVSLENGSLSNGRGISTHIRSASLSVPS